MTVTDAQVAEFRRMIFSWWEGNRRDLPWRRTRDPYRILVSEVMLQQTQVSRVLPKYREFLEAYPTVRDLSDAKTSDVLRIWQGLGYNRRALYLKKTAERIAGEYGEKFPESEKELLKLPGVGTYTVRALLIFAFGKDIWCIDTNIRKIITHFFYKDLPQSAETIEATAARLVPSGQSWEWHQALMDYGAIQLAHVVKGKTVQGNKGTLSAPFKETKRYFRGRIIDVLRERPYARNALTHHLVITFGKEEAFYAGLLQVLEKEGLIAQHGNVYTLPD